MSTFTGGLKSVLTSANTTRANIHVNDLEIDGSLIINGALDIEGDICIVDSKLNDLTCLTSAGLTKSDANDLVLEAKAGQLIKLNKETLVNGDLSVTDTFGNLLTTMSDSGITKIDTSDLSLDAKTGQTIVMKKKTKILGDVVLSYDPHLQFQAENDATTDTNWSVGIDVDQGADGFRPFSITRAATIGAVSNVMLQFGGPSEDWFMTNKLTLAKAVASGDSQLTVRQFSDTPDVDTYWSQGVDSSVGVAGTRPYTLCSGQVLGTNPVFTCNSVGEDIQFDYKMVIDKTDAEAFKVQKNNNSGDIFSIDSSAEVVYSLVPTVVDTTAAEALLVRKAGDTGDIFSVDSSTSKVTSFVPTVVDNTSAEALLVRKAGDTGDIFSIDSSAEVVYSLVPTVIDTTAAEALLVRKAGDTGDIFSVDSSTSKVNSFVPTVIDVTSSEALLVRKAGDTGDIFYVDSQTDSVNIEVGSLYLPNPDGGVSSGFNHYEQGTHNTTWGAGFFDAGAQTGNITYVRVGSLVSLNIPFVNGLSTPGGLIVNTTALPVQLRPSFALDLPCMVDNTGTFLPSMAEIALSGIITVYGAVKSTFPTGTSGWENIVLTYPIN